MEACLVKPLIDSIPILSAFADIEQAIDHLCSHVTSALSTLPIWIQEGDYFTSNRAKAIEVLKTFAPTAGLSAKETFHCPGVIAATHETLKLINEVNAAKDRFLEIIKRYRQKTSANPTKIIRDVLLHHGCGTIKLKMLCRHIKFIQGHPHKVSWTLGKHSGHTTLPIAVLGKRLSDVGEGKHIDIQLEKLTHTAVGSLVRYVPIKPLWVANFCIKTAGQSDERGLLRTGLPVFYLHNSDCSAPTVIISTKKERTVKHRSDKQLEDEPLLPSLRAYLKK